MSYDGSTDYSGHGQVPLRPPLPFIWPGCFHRSRYAENPPFKPWLSQGDLISGLIVGACWETIRWVETLIKTPGKRRICLVVVLYPAGPTREEHLRALDLLQRANAPDGVTLEVRLFPMVNPSDGESERLTIPPTVIQAHNTQTSQTVLSIGSVGDLGYAPAPPGSVNFLFQPEDALRNEWRLWFECTFRTAAKLTEVSLAIPRLVPAKGSPEGASLWDEYLRACSVINLGEGELAQIDPETGETTTTDSEGALLCPWDSGLTELDPLAQVLQQVYANGWLVTVAETTRTKPLAIPVKATLLGQKSERNVGAVTQKQSFSLQVLDDQVNKDIEKRRKVHELLELLTLPLGNGIRWLPSSARPLLDRELEIMDEDGRKILRNAFGDAGVGEYIARRADAIRKDLNGMYKELGKGDAVPDDMMRAIFGEIESRLEQALSSRITPKVIYNRVSPPDLTVGVADENWDQPFGMLSSSVRKLRMSLTDYYFPRQFSGRSFSMEDFQAATDVFSDKILVDRDEVRAKAELEVLSIILGQSGATRGKCAGLWSIIKGTHESIPIR